MNFEFQSRFNSASVYKVMSLIYCSNYSQFDGHVWSITRHFRSIFGQLLLFSSIEIEGLWMWKLGCVFGALMTSSMWTAAAAAAAAAEEEEEWKNRRERESENGCGLAATRVTSQLNIVGFSVTSATNRPTAEDGNSIFSPSQRSLSFSLGSLYLRIELFLDVNVRSVCWPFVVDFIGVEIRSVGNDSVASLSSREGNGRRNCRE